MSFKTREKKIFVAGHNGMVGRAICKKLQKEMLYGENAAINLNHGPAYMLKNSKDFRN